MAFQVDWDAVFAFLEGARLTDWDKEAVGIAAVKAWNTWGLADASLVIIATENFGEYPCRYKIDVTTATESGQLTIADWKSKKAGKLDERWMLRETRSPQPRLYAAAAAELYGGDAIFPLNYEVRGITIGDEKPQVKTLRFSLNSRDAYHAVRTLRSVTAQRDTLIDIHGWEESWPTNDGGCQMYGPLYACPYEGSCWKGEAKPVLINREKIFGAFSHSSMKDFFRCPEYFRLSRGSEEIDEDVDAPSNIGGVFHEAMELIYKQLKSYQEGN